MGTDQKREGAPPSSGGRGRNRGGSFGTGGLCVCAACGHSEPHARGVKCTTLRCPSCGKPLIREELLRERDNRGK